MISRDNFILRPLEYLFILAVILTDEPMYGVLEKFQNVGITTYTFRQAAMIIAMILIIAYLVMGKTEFTRRQLLTLYFAAAYMGLHLVVTRYNINAALEGFIIPFLLFFVLMMLKSPRKAFTEYMNIYENIVVVMAAVSLVFYFGGVITHIIPGQIMQYRNFNWWYSGVNYFYLHFVNDWQTQNILGRSIVRNIGVFMEAPGFAFPLLIALFWSLFGHNEKNLKRACLLTVTLLTTLSTKALVIGAILIFLYMYTEASDKMKFWKFVRWVTFPVLALAAAAFIAYVLIGKMVSSGDSGSWLIRMNDAVAAAAVWMKHPVFGAGFMNLQEVYDHYTADLMKGNPTAGLINIAAYGGTYMFVFYAVPFVRLFVRARNTKSSYVINIFLVILLLLLAASAMQYCYFLILILALGWSLKMEKFELFEKKPDERRSR